MSIKINIGDDMSYIKELAKQNQPKTNRFTGTAQSLIDSQRAAQIEAAKMANQQNLSALDNSAAQLPSYYGTVKDNAAAAKSLGQQAFNEYAAGSGLNTGRRWSGYACQTEHIRQRSRFCRQGYGKQTV